jgi:hypothetical protein
MNAVLGTPLSTQFDQFWNTPDPGTGKTPRQEACDGPNGAKQRLEAQVLAIGDEGTHRAYDISCNLATTGQMVVKQVGYDLFLGYQLLNNTIDFRSTSPQTCGTGFCLDDPRFTVTFASEIMISIHTPDICSLTAENGTVTLHAVQIDSHNASGAIAQFFGGQKFIAAEAGIQASVSQKKLPLDDALKELRESAICTDPNNPGAQALKAFTELETIIAPAQGIVMKLNQLPITPPGIEGPNVATGQPASGASVPSFARPNITIQPIAHAGDTVSVAGQFFPPSRNFATVQPLSLQHGGYGPNSEVLGGPCIGGGTDLEWGVDGGPLHVERLPAQSASYSCAAQYEAKNLTAATRYRFRARDCNAFTCSLWGAPLMLATSASEIAKKVVLALDSVPSGHAPLEVITATPSSIERHALPASNAAPGGSVPLHVRTASVSDVARRAIPTTPVAAGRGASLSATTTSATSLERNAALARSIVLGAATPLLATADITDQGTFATSITIPAGTTAGMHIVHAASEGAAAQANLQVAGAGPGGATATLVLVGSYYGETGCPTHPLPDPAITTGAPFPLFGSGFAPGSLTIHVDSATGIALGTAAVRADRSFCENFQGPPGNLLGDHRLVAVQNGAVQVTTPVKVVTPTVIR